MVKLQSSVKKDSRILVDGTIYEIDGNGIVEVPEEAATKLLQNINWHRAGTKPVSQAKKEFKGIQLLGADGQPITTDAGEEKPAEAKSTSKSGKSKSSRIKSTKPKDPPIPAEGEAWEDPKPEYSMKWLKACADAYQVKFPKNIKKETLCKKLMKAMYE